MFVDYILFMLKDEPHRDLATDEEKLASSIGVKPDQDQIGDYF